MVQPMTHDQTGQRRRQKDHDSAQGIGLVFEHHRHPEEVRLHCGHDIRAEPAAEEKSQGQRRQGQDRQLAEEDERDLTRV